MRLRLVTVGTTERMEHVFGPEGGVFGRSARCDWVLPDPQRILSSVHGRIIMQNGGFLLMDESTNGIFLQGATDPVGRGNAVPLTNGMRFHAGQLTVEVEVLPSASMAGGLPVQAAQSNLLQSSPMRPTGLSSTQQAENALREREQLGDLWGRHSQDPLDYLSGAAAPLGRPASVATDPLVDVGCGSLLPPDLLAPARSPANASAPPGAAGIGATGVGHADRAPRGPSISPLPDRDRPTGAAVFPPAPQPLIEVSPVAAPAPAAAAAPARPADRPASNKLIPDDFDPLSMLGVAPRTAAEPPKRPADAGNWPSPEPVRRPLSPELMADLMAIEPRQPPLPAMPRAPVPAPPMPEPPMPEIAGQGPADFDPAQVMRQRSDERRARLQDKLVQRGGVPASVVTPVGTRPSVAAAGGLLPAEAVQVSASVPPVSTAGGADGAMSPAARALFRGMGFADAAVSRADEERIMQDVGEMVRALTDGLVSLLAARRMVKSEFRMDETQVQPEENNPFKHFRMAELALDELFLTRSGGFLPPGEAAAAALDDVKAHVMVTMAAMQRAIRLFAERLDPKLIAREDGEGADRIRGFGARKGKWESYVDIHQRLSANLDGVARQIIAEAFAQVQEEHARQAVSQFREDRP